MCKVTDDAYALEIRHRQKYGAHVGKPYDDMTEGELIEDFYLDLAVELRDLEKLESSGELKPEELKRLSQIRGIFDGHGEEYDPWLDDDDVEEVDDEELKKTVWTAEDFGGL